MENLFIYCGAFIIGLIMGLMGGGGSILTVPLLVYILGINPVMATAYSLFIVGTTSAFGSAQNYFKGTISVKTGLGIAVPSLISIYITRKYIVPALPQVLLDTGTITLTRGTFIMTLFAVVMLLAAWSMLFRKHTAEKIRQTNYYLVLPLVMVVGIFMGLVGAGGGFIIIPLLVFYAGLPMKKAIGTSLLIIAINSLTGFAGDIQNTTIDWSFLLSFTILSVFGIFAGNYLHRFINENQLKRGFGWFILIMAAFILTKEFTGF